MPSFDVVNRIDMQEVDNAVNNTRRALRNRWDFRNAKFEISFDRKAGMIHLVCEDRMRFDAIKESLMTHAVKRGLDTKSLAFHEKKETTLAIKVDVAVREGIQRDQAKKIVRMIKDMKLKVQCAVQNDQVRVSGKKIDDLQAVIAMLKKADLDIPLQYVNMKP